MAKQKEQHEQGTSAIKSKTKRKKWSRDELQDLIKKDDAHLVNAAWTRNGCWASFKCIELKEDKQVCVCNYWAIIIYLDGGQHFHYPHVCCFVLFSLLVNRRQILNRLECLIN